jgi:hypothetical protein
VCFDTITNCTLTRFVLRSGFGAHGKLDHQVDRRAEGGQPSIETSDGNVIIAVNEAGKQVGYRIGGEVVYFDEMASDIRGQVPALELGFTLGEQSKGTNVILDYLKTELSDRVADIAGAQNKIEASVQSTLDSATAKTTKQLTDAETKAAADFKTFSDVLNKAVTDQLAGADAAVKSKLAKVTTLEETVAGIQKMLKVKDDCSKDGTEYNPIDVKCCGKAEYFSVKDKKCIIELGAKENPAKSCKIMYETYGTSKSNGFFWIKLATGKTLQIWCKFDGDYPGTCSRF